MFRRMASPGGLGIVLILCCLMGPEIRPNDPLNIDLSLRLAPPSLRFPMGTDQLGRCVLSRTLCGARLSLAAGLFVTAASLSIGFIVGLFSGLATSRMDRWIMGCVDLALAFPLMIFAVAVTGVLGPSLKSAIIGLISAGWAWWARFVRGLTLAARQKEFVVAGRITGVQGAALARRYILPQILPEILVAASLNAGAMIVTVSGLGFLGLGAPPPTPEWGSMLKEARMYFGQAPWMMLSPGLGLGLCVLTFNRMGEGFRETAGNLPAARTSPSRS